VAMLQLVPVGHQNKTLNTADLNALAEQACVTL
jgi:hypothetical protein